MALPTTREELKQYCLRNLGYPVLEINTSDEQLEDRIDEALQYFTDYHFDATEKVFYKHLITAADLPSAVKTVRVVSGGSGYSNGASLTFTGDSQDVAVGTITTNGSGSITSVTISVPGTGYKIAPTVTAPGGTGASLTAELGGWIDIPQNIMGVVNVFDVYSGIGGHGSDLFNVQYQIYLNDVWTFMSSSMVPYYMTMQHLRLLEQILVGQQPLRYNRHRNRMHLDMSPEKWAAGKYLLVEAYQIVDPDEFRDVWKDRWLLRYTTALFKRQFGTNLKKFTGMPMPGGIQFNGQQIYDEAIEEIDALEKDMIMSYSIPVSDMYG